MESFKQREVSISFQTVGEQQLNAQYTICFLNAEAKAVHDWKIGESKMVDTVNASDEGRLIAGC